MSPRIALLVLIAANLSLPTLSQAILPSAFTPMRDQLQHIDEFIRAEDQLDRASTDKAIAVLAKKLGEVEKDAQAFADECSAAHTEEVYLSNKAQTIGILIDATQTKQALLQQQLAMSEAEVAKLDAATAVLSTSHDQRVVALAKLAKQLTASLSAPAKPASLDAGLFQESMALETEATKFFSNEGSFALPSTSPSPSPSTIPPTRDQQIADAVATISAFSKQLTEASSIGTRDELLAVSVEQMRLKLQIAELSNALDNLTSSSTEWLQLSDYKHRQLIASEPILAANDRLVAKLRDQIHEIANAYQVRRNGRVRQLCDVVSARRLLAKGTEEIVAAPYLPGPSQHASATVTAVQDTTLDCSAPAHPFPKVDSPKKTIRCARGVPSMDGRKTLDDSWSALSNVTDCDPLRIVDTNDLALV